MRLRILFFLLVWCSRTEANFVGNDTSNFNPTTSGLNFVTIESSETLAPGLLNVGLFFNQAANVLPDTVDSIGHRIGSKDKLTFADFSVAYGLTERFDLGVSFSYLMSQETNRDASGAQFSATGLNSIRLGTKYTLIKRDPVGMAFILSSNFNMTNENPFVGNSAGPTVNLETAIDYQVGPVVMGVNFGYRKRNSGGPIANAVYQPLSDEVIASTAISYYSTKIDTKFIAEAIFSKPTDSSRYVQSNQVSSEALLGAKWDVSESLALHVGGGARLTDGLFSPDWRAYVGLNYSMDLLGGGRHSPQTVVKLKHIQGYLPEDIEALKATPFDEIAQNHEFVLRKDIPSEDFHGEKPPFEIIRLDNFNFASGSSVIKKELYADLDHLISYLSQEPEVIKIRVEGHTDSIGSPQLNRQISQARANALKNYLESKGLKGKFEIEPAGFGPDRPIADNSNFQGRMQNRRVEFRILRKISPIPERIE